MMVLMRKGAKGSDSDDDTNREEKNAAQEYVEARKEMKPPPVSGKQQKNFMNEMVLFSLRGISSW